MNPSLLRRAAAGLAVVALGAAGLTTIAAPARADSDRGYVIGTVKDNAGRPLTEASVYADFCRTNTDGGAPDANGCYDYPIGGLYGNVDRNGRFVIGIDKDYLLTYPNAGVQGHWIVAAEEYQYVDSAAITVAPQVGVNVAGPAFALVPDGAFIPPPPGTYNFTGVVATSTGAPASGGSVVAYDAATNNDIEFATVYPDGRYYLDVTPGTAVKLSFYRTGSVAVWSGGGQAQSKATVVGAPAAATPLTVNAVLGALGTITGTIKLPAAGNLWDAGVTVYDANGQDYDGASTDAAGNFSLDVEPGVYYVRGSGYRFTERADPGECPACTDRADSFDFVAGYYGKAGKKKGGPATSLFTATPITVAANGSVSVGTITLTNALANVEKPTVKAKKGLKKGAKVSVTPGVWNDQVRAQYTVTWKVGKKVVGTGTTLKLSKKVWKKVSKKPKKFTVTVVATDKYGEYVDGSVRVKVVKALAKKKG